MEVTGALSPRQPRWILRKRKVVLYDQEMIVGEGVRDENLWLFKKRKSSGRLKIKAKKLIRNLRQSSKPVIPGNMDNDPGYDDTVRETVEIDETTPRRSARCCKLSQKMIQIKKEMQEETEQQEEAIKLVKKRKTYPQVEMNKNNDKINERPEEIPTGLRRSSRTSKPTKEIVNCREELKDDNIGVKRRGRYLHRSKKLNLIENASLVNSEQRVRCSSSTAEPVSHPTSLGVTMMPPPVKRKVSRPPAEEQDAGADITTITPGQARKMCTMMKNIPQASEHVLAVQVRPLEELLAVSSCEDTEIFSENTTEDPTSPKKKKFVVLTESEGGNDKEDAQLSPATLMKPVHDMRDWNCFQCVYELTRKDARLTMADLDPLLEKMVDGDALMKSSLSDLVNVVGLQYSPAVRVVFLVQKMTEDASGE